MPGNKKRGKITFLRAVLFAVPAILLLLSGSYAEETLLEKAAPEQKKLFADIKPVILRGAAQTPLQLKDSEESYFWLMSARIIPLLQAYHYSHDPVFLAAYVPLQEQILSQRFIHTTRPEWKGWFNFKGNGEEICPLIDHDTILYYVPVLMFVKEVREDPKLKEKYGAKAEAWFKDVEESIRDWDKRGCWHDLDEKTGYYSTVTEYPDKDGNVAKNKTIFSGGTVQYNKVNALYEALCLAYRMTGDSWYRVRMEKSAKFWRDHWREDGKHVEWNYRDHYLPADYESGVVGKGKTRTGAWVHRKGGYYRLDVSAATMLYDVGIFFKQPDMEKLIKTNLEFMWRKDTTPPTFKNINGVYNASGVKYNYDKGWLWTSLAHFDPRIRDLWKLSIENSKKGWVPWSDTLGYLIEMSQPVNWEPRYIKEIPKK